MSSKPKILFIYLKKTSFVKEDLKILSEFWEVDELQFKPSGSFFVLLTSFFKQLIWLSKNLRKYDLSFCWFSDYHGLFPLIFSLFLKIPFITVLGGYDCNKIKSLNYGIFCSTWRTPIAKYILKNSTLLLPVEPTLIETTKIAESWGEAHPNGVKNNIDGFSNNWKSIPTGYDPEFWILGPEKRKKIITTVALVSNKRTALVKGWDLFVEIARILQDFQFQIVGCSDNYVEDFKLEFNPPKNLQFTPPLQRKELLNIYQKTSVYVQLSRTEGMPNVISEAMMCGCIPVGSPVFGIPGLIQDIGLIATNTDPADISSLIEQAHRKAPEKRLGAREHIINNFSLQKRKAEIHKIVIEHLTPK